jgi:serine/threonine-protein kinase
MDGGMREMGKTIAWRTAGSTATPSALPADLLASASKRLGLAGLAMSVIIAVNLVIFSLVPLLGGPDPGRPPGAIDLVVLFLLGLSIGVWFLARSKRLEARRMLDVGLAYEVALAFTGGVVLQLVAGRPVLPHGGVSYAVIVILLFPVIVPNTPIRTFVASLLAAAMDPIGALLAGSRSSAFPGLGTVAIAYHWNFLCAGLAVIPSAIITRLGRDVRKAREIGVYRLTERLGEGGMGEVWRARHHLLARDAAIKVIHPERLLAGGEETKALLARFEREAQATAALESPHTVELYDFGVTEEGTFFYVMEFLDGLDLDSLVRRHGPVPSERVVRILVQVCHSLADAHVHGLVHRDVKPANVFLCRKGLDTDFVKVLDFGLVKARGAGSDDANRTMESAVIGTPAYMAPEMIRSGRKIDGRADLYSLGCVAYWLLTGRLVFDATSPVDVMIQHVNNEPEPPSARSELEVDRDLERVVLQCLMKDPDDRPPSAAELMARLESLPIARRWTPERSREWWDRHAPVARAKVLPEAVGV